MPPNRHTPKRALLPPNTGLDSVERKGGPHQNGRPDSTALAITSLNPDKNEPGPQSR